MGEAEEAAHSHVYHRRHQSETGYDGVLMRIFFFHFHVCVRTCLHVCGHSYV